MTTTRPAASSRSCRKWGRSPFRRLRYALRQTRGASRLSAVVRVRLFGRGNVDRRTRPGIADPNRDDPARGSDLRQCPDPNPRRRRHGLRQCLECLPNGDGADRAWGRRLLPGRPGVAEEVRTHARQTAGASRRIPAKDSRCRGGAGRSRFLYRRADGRAWRWKASTRPSRESRPPVQAGADASFVEAPESRETLVEIGRRSPPPNVANMIEGGRTPVLSQAELAELGFQLILYPLAGLFAAAQAIETVYQQLRDRRDDGPAVRAADDVLRNSTH